MKVFISKTLPSYGQNVQLSPKTKISRQFYAVSLSDSVLCVCVYFRIVKQETLRAQQASPDRGRMNGCVETRPMDILQLLSKAKEEYNRVRLQIALVRFARFFIGFEQTESSVIHTFLFLCLCLWVCLSLCLWFSLCVSV